MAENISKIRQKQGFEKINRLFERVTAHTISLRDAYKFVDFWLSSELLRCGFDVVTHTYAGLESCSCESDLTIVDGVLTLPDKSVSPNNFDCAVKAAETTHKTVNLIRESGKEKQDIVCYDGLYSQTIAPHANQCASYLRRLATTGGSRIIKNKYSYEVFWSPIEDGNPVVYLNLSDLELETKALNQITGYYPDFIKIISRNNIFNKNLIRI